MNSRGLNRGGFQLARSRDGGLLLPRGATLFVATKTRRARPAAKWRPLFRHIGAFPGLRWGVRRSLLDLKSEISNLKFEISTPDLSMRSSVVSSVARDCRASTVPGSLSIRGATYSSTSSLFKAVSYRLSAFSLLLIAES